MLKSKLCGVFSLILSSFLCFSSASTLSCEVTSTRELPYERGDITGMTIDSSGRTFASWESVNAGAITDHVDLIPEDPTQARVTLFSTNSSAIRVLGSYTRRDGVSLVALSDRATRTTKLRILVVGVDNTLVGNRVIHTHRRDASGSGDWFKTGSFKSGILTWTVSSGTAGQPGAGGVVTYGCSLRDNTPTTFAHCHRDGVKQLDFMPYAGIDVETSRVFGVVNAGHLGVVQQLGQYNTQISLTRLLSLDNANQIENITLRTTEANNSGHRLPSSIVLGSVGLGNLIWAETNGRLTSTSTSIQSLYFGHVVPAPSFAAGPNGFFSYQAEGFDPEGAPGKYLVKKNYLYNSHLVDMTSGRAVRVRTAPLLSEPGWNYERGYAALAGQKVALIENYENLSRTRDFYRMFHAISICR